MKKLLCLFLACISVTLFCFFIGCQDQWMRLKEGTYSCNQFGRDPFDGELVIKEISEAEYKKANGINVLKASYPFGRYKYMSVSCYYIDEKGVRTDFIFEDLQEYEFGRKRYGYVDKNGSKITPWFLDRPYEDGALVSLKEYGFSKTYYYREEN